MGKLLLAIVAIFLVMAASNSSNTTNSPVDAGTVAETVETVEAVDVQTLTDEEIAQEMEEFEAELRSVYEKHGLTLDHTEETVITNDMTGGDLTTEDVVLTEDLSSGMGDVR